MCHRGSTNTEGQGKERKRRGERLRKGERKREYGEKKNERKGVGDRRLGGRKT